VSVTVVLAESIASQSEGLGRGTGAAVGGGWDDVETGAGSVEELCCLPPHARAVARAAIAGIQDERSS
jgi:hypothetical protein